MKIIHVADLHLEGGYKKVSGDKNKLLRDEGLQLFANLISFANKEKVDVILICGDLFDKLSVRKSTLKFVVDQIKSVPNIRFFYCLGNHDNKKLFEDDLPQNLYIFPVGFSKIDLGDVSIGGNSVIKYEEQNFVDSINFDKDKINIFMLHAFLSGAHDNDCLSFDVKDLKNKNIDYLALGHIHKRQNGRIDDRGEWVYSGNFGDYLFGDFPKGFVLIEIVNKKIIWRRIDLICKRKFFEFYVDLSDCQSFLDLKNKIKNQVLSASCDDFVRLYLTGEYEEGFEKKVDYIFSEFNDKFFYFDIVDESKIKIDVEKLKKETLSLKAEFIKLVYDSDLPEMDKQKIVKVGISALLNEEVEL